MLSTQQEVATVTRESLEKNTEEMNSVQESNRKPIESASSETMVRAAYRPANLTEQTQYFEGLRSLEDDNRQEHRHSRHNRRNNERNDKNDNNKGRRGSGRGNNNKNDNSKVHQDAISRNVPWFAMNVSDIKQEGTTIKTTTKEWGAMVMVKGETMGKE